MTNPSSPPPKWTEFLWYMSGHGTYFLAMGIQSVVFPYLVTFVLKMPADKVGLAQMFSLLPMFGLVLFGGMTADRRELRMYLVRLQILAALPIAALAILVFTNTLTFFLLVLCNFASGAIGAFVLPARDSLLNRVARRSPSGDIAQAVSYTTGVQFGMQVIGLTIGRMVALAGAGIMLIGVIFSLFVAAFCATNLLPAPPGVPASDANLNPNEKKWRRNYREIKEGLTQVRHSERMASVIFMMFLGGIFVMGALLVLLQILIRDVYQGDISDFTIIMICFTIGITFSTTLIGRFFSIHHQGRAMMVTFANGALVLTCIHFHPPLWGLYLLVFFWGSTAGITMSTSRTIVQELAIESHRARIMSVFQLGFLGGAPLGALLIGYLTRILGPLDAALVSAGGITIAWAGLFFFTDLWNLTREKTAI